MFTILNILVMFTLLSGITYILLTEWSRNIPPTIEYSESDNKIILLTDATAVLFISSFIGTLLWILTIILTSIL